MTASRRPVSGPAAIRRLVPGLTLLLASAACTSDSPPPSAAPAVTVTATTTVTVTQPAVTVVVTAPAPPEAVSWPAETDVQGGAPAPEFPTRLDGWQLAESWSALPRAFTGGSWTKPSGPYDGYFPDTMNGCDTQRFLVRWRALDETATVLARWNTQDIAFGEPTSGNAGWMDLDGCRAPEFTLTGDTPAGGTLTDVTVALERWTPAP